MHDARGHSRQGRAGETFRKRWERLTPPHPPPTDVGDDTHYVRAFSNLGKRENTTNLVYTLKRWMRVPRRPSYKNVN